MQITMKGFSRYKKMKKEKIEITKSSGNVFEDMNFPDAQEALAKSKLAMMIYFIIESQELSQAKAAEIMGTEQARVSDIIRGKLSGFTIDRLFKFLLALGQDIEIKIKNHSKNDQPPSISVLKEPIAI